MFRLTFLIIFSCATTACSAEDRSQFLEQHCADCHSGSDAEAGFDIASLKTSLDNPDVFRKWVRVVDRVQQGEMPPPDAAELSKAERKQFSKTTGQWLRNFQQNQQATLGRVRGRRLTNLQLERTLHDLLGIDIPLASQLPEESPSKDFTTIANGQSMSHFQLEQHLGVVDAALDEAFRRADSRDDLRLKQFSARQLARRNPRRRTREPEMRNGQAVVWAGGVTYYGRLPATTARFDGWYRFAIRASAVKKPEDTGVWCSVRSGRCVSSAPLLSWVTSFELSDEPQEWTFDAWLPRGEMLEIRPADATLKQARFRGGQIGTGEGEPQNVPGLAIDSMTMQRIHKGPPTSTIREWLFGSLQRNSDDAEKRIRKQVHRFAQRAFRRPVDWKTTQTFARLALDELEDGASPQESLRAAYRAILCSPRFLYFNESPGELDEYALASRLSYFLWNTMPDRPLMTLAEYGELSAKLPAEVDRMLNHSRGKQFVRDFAHEWLELNKIDFTQPDRRLYPKFDPVVQNSMLDETHAFLQHLLADNLSVTHLVDSDFTFLNSRLAAFYALPKIEGDELRQVKLDADSRRGGLMTQGAILKVTANGTTTSPVVRGVWVAERILGEDIPPPPENVPAIEPDIRGTKSIRDMLAKHRSDASCASCHVKIDPAGFALENFDAAGQWRDRYYHRNRKRRHPVDASYTLADGRSFNDVGEFRRLLAESPAQLAKNLVVQLMTYGTGATVGFADREHIDVAVADAAEDDYGFRSLVKAVVVSPIFRHK